MPLDFNRSHDPAKLNALLNHPRIRPNMGGEGELDGTPLLGIFYLSDHGGMLFHESDPGLWEGHYLFTARAPYDLALGMVRAFMLEARPRMLWGRVPVANRAARLFSRKIGLTSLGIRQRPFPAEIFAWKRALCPSSATFLVR
jgi:hypothetical protein